MTDIPPDANVVMMDQEFGTQVMNQSDLTTSEIMENGKVIGSNRSLMAALGEWSQTVSGGQRRNGGLFERDRYVTPTRIFDQMKLAYHAVENDDNVSNIADASEAMAFNSVGFYAEDQDEEDIYNQIAADINLDARLREMWRELFTVSQFTVGVWWHTKTYKVRGKGKSRSRRQEYSVRCPKAITIIDPLKVIPVGNTMFNQEILVYAADPAEDQVFSSSTPGQDPIKDRLILGKYVPTMSERQMLGNLGGDVSAERLWTLNPANVFRHTLTRSQFNRFASVRMQSIFELLDLKAQQRAGDRAHLLGAANFIILITKGSDALPALPQEIANLQASVRTVAKIPIMVGDHRLHVEIITPNMDNTLKPEKYNLLDGRITARLYNMFVLGGTGGSGGGTGGSGASGDDSLKLASMISRGMESRRSMIVRSLEKNLFDPIFEKNDKLTTRPRLRFHPQNIDITFDAGRAAMVLNLRDRGEISRETALSQFEFDQGDEARYLEREGEPGGFDTIFKTINPNNQGVGNAGDQAPQGDPSGKPGPANPAPNTNGDPKAQRRAGQAGKNKGGAAPGTGQGKAPRNPTKISDEEQS